MRLENCRFMIRVENLIMNFAPAHMRICKNSVQKNAVVQVRL